MGSGISVNQNDRKYAETIDQTRARTTSSKNKDAESDIEKDVGNEKKVNLLVERIIYWGNALDVITYVLKNSESKHSFIKYLRKEFEKNNLVIESWRVRLRIIYISTLLI
jgi:hypoxanthine-guanine phosphoribosyltransferase